MTTPNDGDAAGRLPPRGLVDRLRAGRVCVSPAPPRVAFDAWLVAHGDALEDDAPNAVRRASAAYAAAYAALTVRLPRQ
jgi:hypothetical protein